MTDRIYAAEFVFPGHPDKLSDAIADALVQEAAKMERRALVGVEVAVHRNRVFVTGRIACEGASDIDVAASYGTFTAQPVTETVGIPPRRRSRSRPTFVSAHLRMTRPEYRALSDDQSICTGYAVAIPETNYLPVEHWLANRLGRSLTEIANEFPDLRLGPDGKVVVLLCEDADNRCLEGFSCSLQQREGADDVALHRAVRVALEREMVALAKEAPCLSGEVPTEIFVNGAGTFDVGGPEGDNGLSGKKLVVDAYGPRVPIGGGALSGKDFFKADRAGAIHARRVAKGVVITGAAREALVKLTWFPGDRRARLLSIEVENGQLLDVRPWEELFDLSLEASGEAWGRNVNLVQVARTGHFTDENLSWEKIRFSSAS